MGKFERVQRARVLFAALEESRWQAVLGLSVAWLVVLMLAAQDLPPHLANGAAIFGIFVVYGLHADFLNRFLNSQGSTAEGVAHALESVQACINRFDFESALAALTGWTAPPTQMPEHPGGHSQIGSRHAA